MKRMLVVCCTAVLSGCSPAVFVGDAQPVPLASHTPDHFDLPAKFAVARSVYGTLQPASTKEAVLWTDLSGQFISLGSFSPLVMESSPRRQIKRTRMIEAARQQRYNYLLLVQMFPATGTANVMLVHVSSGGVMATSQVHSPGGGRRGFWGNKINNPARLDRATYKIAKATVPAVKDMLQGVASRAR